MSGTDLTAIEAELTANISAASDLAAIEQVRISALGRKGRVSELMGRLGKMPPDERKSFGASVNQLKDRVTAALEARKEALETAALAARLASEQADVTLPVRHGPIADGRIHPISQVFDEIAEIFADMGFAIAEGPDIETDDYNFTKLNIPPEHPARQMHDTFYLKSPERIARGEAPMLLRTHTSPVQVRTMLSQKPPIRIIVPGRVYRMDSDATHTPMFHQIEGLVIDKGIHLGHLKWTLETFIRAYFERDDMVLRLRPSYFPFTEPSVEVDVGFSWVNGQRVLGGSGDAENGGWMELLGSGMVHPNVIRNCGLDPDEWQGFAFGVGVDRLAMLKYGMNDLRAFFDGDLRWLRHYGFSALDVPTLSGGVGA